VFMRAMHCATTAAVPGPSDQADDNVAHTKHHQQLRVVETRRMNAPVSTSSSGRTVHVVWWANPSLSFDFTGEWLTGILFDQRRDAILDSPIPGSYCVSHETKQLFHQWPSTIYLDSLVTTGLAVEGVNNSEDRQCLQYGDCLCQLAYFFIYTSIENF